MIKTCWVGGPPQSAPLKTRKPLKVIKETLTQPMTVRTISNHSGYDVSHVRKALHRLMEQGLARCTKGGVGCTLWELT